VLAVQVGGDVYNQLLEQGYVPDVQAGILRKSGLDMQA
jgi:hypothetical protein